MTMYRHKRSSIVHVMAENTTHGTFSCGVTLTGDYAAIAETPFLDLRKCKRCASARPIRDVGAFAAALKKQRLEHNRPL